MNLKQKKLISAYENPVWIKYECDKGARWTSVRGGSCEHPLNKECNFSGCPTGHGVAIKGETSNRDEAHEWFKRPERRGAK